MKFKNREYRKAIRHIAREGGWIPGREEANAFNNPLQFKIGLTTWDRFRNSWEMISRFGNKK